MAAAINSTHVRPDTLSAKHLTFSLAGRDYGISILKVREVIGAANITTAGQMPPQVKGVVNRRGKVIPVVDLRTRFGMPETEYTEQTCVVVVGDDQMIGIIVDAVREVFCIDADQISPARRDAGDDSRFITGVGKVEDRVKLLLDVDKLIEAVAANGV